MATVTDYTALLTGSNWSGIEVTGKPVFVTYSFDATAPASDANSLSASAYATFTPFTAAQQTEAQQALAAWGGSSGVVFLQVAPGKGDINFASYDFFSDPNARYAGGMGFYPWGNWDYSTYPYFSADLPGSGNILMNRAFVTGGLFAYATVLHEIGHAIGLKHPDEAWTNYGTSPPTVHNIWDPNVALPASIMDPGATTLTGLGAIDIQAIQADYGTAAQQGSQDASWSWNAATATLTQRMSNAATNETRGVSTSNVIYAGSGTDTVMAVGAGTNTVHAGAGTDLIVGGSGTNFLFAGAGADTFIGSFGKTFVEYTAAPAAVTVNLLAPWTDAGWAANDTLVNVHNLYGSGFADTLVADNTGGILHGGNGNDALTGGTGKDQLFGDAGNDTLYGGTGADTLTGGAGADVFVYTALADSTVAASGRDTITDFSHGQGDRIDLAALATAIGHTISFIGSAGFGGTAGQLRAAASGANTLVQLDSNGDKRADFAILLKGSVALTAADFILNAGLRPAYEAAISAGSGGTAHLATALVTATNGQDYWSLHH